MRGKAPAIGRVMACRMHRPKVFVTLKPGVPADEETKKAIMDFAAKGFVKYAMPKEPEFGERLSSILAGKVTCRRLGKEEAAKRKAAGE